MAAQDTAAAQLMKGDPAVELEEYRSSLGDAGFTVDGFNAYAVSKRGGLSVRAVIGEWGRAVDTFLTRCAAIPGP